LPPWAITSKLILRTSPLSHMKRMANNMYTEAATLPRMLTIT
jgi:hypothetical protein